MLSDMAKLAKALVAAAQTRMAESRTYSPLGAYMGNDGDVLIVTPEREDFDHASTHILLKLRNLAGLGNLRAAAVCRVFNKKILSSLTTFIQVHVEHAAGKVLVVAVPSHKSVLLTAGQEVEDASEGGLGSWTRSKIFSPRD